MDQKTLGVGVVGAGVIFQDHARALTQLAPRARLVGLADIDLNRANRAARNFFVPIITDDYHQLLVREDIDIVCVCTPPSLHEQVVVDALEAGKYVLCEKPLAHTLAAADRIIDVSRRHPNRLSVVYQIRYSPEVLRTQWLIEQGELGPLQFGRYTRIGGIPAAHRVAGSWWGRWDTAGGGALMTQSIHELDQALLLFGPARRVTAAMATVNNEIESEDTIAATIEHESGVVVSISCALGHEVGFRVQSEVLGRDMAVHYPWALNTNDRGKRNHLNREAAKRFPGNAPRSFLPGKLGVVWRKVKRRLGFGKRQAPSPHTPCIRALLDAISAGGPLPVPPEDARRSLELCIAIYTAAITGEPVELPLPDNTPFYGGITVDDYQRKRAPLAAEEVPT